MWIILVLLPAPYLIYGLITGRITIGGGVPWATYSRQTQPAWYWSAAGTYILLMSWGVVGIFHPDAAELVLKAAVPILLVATLAILATALRRKPRDGYLGDRE